MSWAINKFPDNCALLEIAGMLEFGAGDPFAAPLLIEEAVAKGLPYRPHSYQAAVATMCLLGQFERARRLLEGIAPQDGRHLHLHVAAAEQRWAAAESTFGSGTVSRNAVIDALAKKDFALVAYLTCRLFSSPTADAEDYILVADVARSLNGRGYIYLNELISKGRAAAFFCASHSLKAVEAFAESLIQECAFSDSAQLYLSLAYRDESPIGSGLMLRMALFFNATGAIQLSTLRRLRRDLGSRIWDLNLLNYADRVIALKCGEKIGPERRAGWLSSVRPPSVRPRIALCLSGQFRGYAEAWKRTRNVLDQHDVTVFIATWPRVGHGTGAQGSIDRLLPPFLVAGLPKELRSREIIENRYPSLYRLIVEDDSASDEMSLRAVYCTEHVALLDEDALEKRLAPHPGLMALNSFNQAKSYFALHESLAARAAHEEKVGMFDVTIICRPDRALEALSDCDLRAVSDRRVYRTDHFYAWAVGHQTGIMSSGVADDLRDIWPAIWDARSFACFRGASGRAAEWLMGEVLVGRGVAVQSLRGTRFSRPVANSLAPEEVLAALLQDVQGEGQDDLDRLFIGITEANVGFFYGR
jgi:hypothetical protein